MSRLYSPSTGSCYSKGVHTVIPDDVIFISDEVFLSVIGNPEPGKVRRHDADGVPYLIGAPTDPAGDERAWRDSQVNATEWLVNRHRDELDMQLETTLLAAQFSELLKFRQALRDWPQSDLFPAFESRPLAPTWLDELTL